MTKQASREMSVEDYIRYELQSERRHEFINGMLIEMPGEKDIHNELAGTFYLLLMTQLRHQGYYIYSHDVKVAIPGQKKFYYPDVFATKEAKHESNLYIKSEPELIVEVVSESSQRMDYVDKYLDYIQIPSLHYYIIAEPETLLVTVNERDKNTGEWVAKKYTRLDETVQLPLLNIELPMQDIYPQGKR